ncbi:transporter [Halolamina salifodinae]|uniref:DUF7978 domain-containing protein n=1 Tax=Halolamina salifodinae TaxID=1202767 RepID=A0A8T4GUW7_9EURY|nr:transporter [Halolamina salifodinae]MBP1986686.1 hypothetical protein [Halolamina salifodinae]
MATDSLTERLPLAQGAAAGVGAYLLGYLITYLATSGSVEERLASFNFIADLFGGDTATVWQGVGWLFYNAHFVRTRATGGFGGPRSQNFIAASDGGAVVLLYLVPVILLLAAGLAVARLGSADDLADGAVGGATVVLGYLPLALLGRFLFDYDGSVAPDLVTAVLLAGLVYPLVFGALGGAAWSSIGD